MPAPATSSRVRRARTRACARRTRAATRSERKRRRRACSARRRPRRSRSRVPRRRRCVPRRSRRGRPCGSGAAVPSSPGRPRGSTNAPPTSSLVSPTTRSKPRRSTPPPRPRDPGEEGRRSRGRNRCPSRPRRKRHLETITQVDDRLAPHQRRDPQADPSEHALLRGLRLEQRELASSRVGPDQGEDRSVARSRACRGAPPRGRRSGRGRRPRGRRDRASGVSCPEFLAGRPPLADEHLGGRMFMRLASLYSWSRVRPATRGSCRSGGRRGGERHVLAGEPRRRLRLAGACPLLVDGARRDLLRLVVRGAAILGLSLTCSYCRSRFARSRLAERNDPSFARVRPEGSRFAARLCVTRAAGSGRYVRPHTRPRAG